MCFRVLTHLFAYESNQIFDFFNVGGRLPGLLGRGTRHAVQKGCPTRALRAFLQDASLGKVSGGGCVAITAVTTIRIFALAHLEHVGEAVN